MFRRITENDWELYRHYVDVFYHTDYSSSRKDMLKRDMAFSSTEEQIREIMANNIASNVKKGWQEIS